MKDKKNVLLSKKKKAELILKVRVAFPKLDLKLNIDTEDLTWSEIEALGKARRKVKIVSRWKSSQKKEKMEKAVEGRIIDLPNNKFIIITNDLDLPEEELIAMYL